MVDNDNHRASRLSLKKSLLFLILFFVVAPIALGTSILSLSTIANSKEKEETITPRVLSTSSSGVQVYASLPSKIPTVSSYVVSADARGEIIKQYLDRYKSPLVPYAEFIVATADEYEIDYRLTTAIAQQESNLCKKIPAGTYNCWGWGIHSQGTLAFETFEQGLEEVSRGLRQEYLDKGFIKIEDIMSKYTPLSKGSWAFGVNKFMNQMQ